MGVDYTAVGGIGLMVDNEIKKKLVMANEGDFDGCLEGLLSDLELEYQETGDGSYSGEENSYYIMIEGSNLSEIQENSITFIEKMKNMGIKITEEDLEVVSELHVC